jgi:hypothetical protein
MKMIFLSYYSLYRPIKKQLTTKKGNANMEDATTVTTPVDTKQVDDGIEVETNIVSEPAKEEEVEVVDSEQAPKEAPPEKKAINPRTLARKAEKERLIRENGALQERVKQFEQAQAQRQPEVKQERDISEEPNIQDFDDVFEYNRAIAKYEAAQIYKQETSRQSTEKKIEAMRQRSEVVRVEKPDFNEKVQALVDSQMLTPTIEDAILTSDLSADISYHLAQYGDDLLTLRGLPQNMLPQAIKRIEAFIKEGGKQEKPKVTQAQPPITPPGVRAKTDRSVSSYTQEEIENMPLSEYRVKFMKK